MDAVTQLSGQLRSRPISHLSVNATTACLDVFAMSLGLWFACYSALPTSQFTPVSSGLWAGLCAVATAGFGAFFRSYDPQTLMTFGSSMIHGFSGFFVLLGVASLADLGRGAGLEWLLQSAAFVVPLMLGLRLGMRSFARWGTSFGALERRAIIAGGGEAAEKLIHGLAAMKDNDVRVVAIFEDRNTERSPAQVLGVPTIGGFSDVPRFVSVAEIDLVLVALPLEAEARIKEILEGLKTLPHQIHLVDFSKDLSFLSPGGFGLVLAQAGTFDLVRRWQKRAFDVVFSSLLLLLWSPVMLLTAIAIRLESPGPVLFVQLRHGFANKEVPVLKFRSMYFDQSDSGGVNVVQRGGDNRVTRVGALIRKTSIDELPQLFCVLRGDLSLVGPRPHAIDARSSNKVPFTELVEGYAARHRLPPGVTGWAQVHGLRGGIDQPEKLKQRVEHDLYYIENWSIWFDLKILLRTPLALLNTKNAY